jgi:hypothetical protein
MDDILSAGELIAENILVFTFEAFVHQRLAIYLSIVIVNVGF